MLAQHGTRGTRPTDRSCTDPPRGPSSRSRPGGEAGRPRRPLPARTSGTGSSPDLPRGTQRPASRRPRGLQAPTPRATHSAPHWRQQAGQGPPPAPGLVAAGAAHPPRAQAPAPAPAPRRPRGGQAPSAGPTAAEQRGAGPAAASRPRGGRRRRARPGPGEATARGPPRRSAHSPLGAP